MKKLMTMAAIVVAAMVSAKDVTKTNYFAKIEGVTKGKCTLHLWYTNPVTGVETHWIEVYNTNTEAACTAKLKERLNQLADTNPCGNGNCPE
jgi:hypothetical protein